MPRRGDPLLLGPAPDGLFFCPVCFAVLARLLNRAQAKPEATHGEQKGAWPHSDLPMGASTCAFFVVFFFFGDIGPSPRIHEEVEKSGSVRSYPFEYLLPADQEHTQIRIKRTMSQLLLG